MANKRLNNYLNSGRARKADNKRLCRELLKKGNSQRQIAKILNVSLQTANTYCQEIAKEIEDIHKTEVQEAQKVRRKTLDRQRAIRISKQEAIEAEPEEPKTPEELAKAGFTACLRELQIRLPTMTNEEVMKITVDLWDRVNK